MPIVQYTLCWPDGQRSECASPSVVIRDFLEVGHEYPLDDFVERVKKATAAANERVQARYGFVCWSAMEHLGHIQDKARQLHGKGLVRVLSLTVEAS